ncbi:MAG: transporter substrate-binding protein [Parachlamydiaceae bacterium]|nr:transporter substrate-binding protein [Parachlamydiaceae bacterium]
MKTSISIFIISFLLIKFNFLSFGIPFFSEKIIPIKVGVLYSTTGFRAKDELPVQQATLMAIDEINKKGGLGGRLIQPIIRNADSDPQTTVLELEKLLAVDKVSVVFGCWIQDDRNTIIDILEKYQNLLIYPFEFDGVFESNNIVFVGMTANQQVTPTVSYSLKNFGNRFFLIGADYVYSHMINRMIRDQVHAKGGQIVGEYYVTSNSTNFDEMIKEIKITKPDVIINSMLYTDAVLFYKELRKAGITADQIPTFSLNTTETALANTENIDALIGNHATWSYFKTINTPQNQKFVKEFYKFSKLTEIDNNAEAAYIGVYLWFQAAEETGHTDYKSLKQDFDDMRFMAPGGPVTIDNEGEYTWKRSRIGRVRSDKEFDIIWQSNDDIEPQPSQSIHSYRDLEDIIEENSDSEAVNEKK